ncbi:hypothetical protein [Rhizobium alvei]|uniref:CopG family transcriptional regulator n=1 Tax=Rhizobium alvei TaxID=1132659 RepID=A0ABT8YHB2_9HYPH|nr:hypothetical protein [Rhizobium alvei]MDO6962649.1 hypothetical protein [Rhizobium alvei]
MPETLSIELPDDLRSFAERQVRLHGFGSLSHYIAHLLAEARDTTDTLGDMAERVRRQMTATDEEWLNEELAYRRLTETEN